MEAFLGIAGIVVAVLLYYLGRRHGRRDEQERRAHEREEEKQREERELASKVADEYVEMARRGQDNGPHAMARLGLHKLGSDQLIREAIHEMEVRSGSDPWQGHSRHVDGVDLVRFFRYVREHNIDFFNRSVEEIARIVRES